MTSSLRCARILRHFLCVLAGVFAGGVVHAGDVDANDMQRYCQSAAASRFDRKPSEIATRPTERSGSEYVVAGQFPPAGNNVVSFECLFDWNGSFRAIRTTTSGGGAGRPIAIEDMPRYCAREAASKFDQRPSTIVTYSAERNGPEYIVYGQYPPDGKNVTRFQCRFDQSRIFRVAEQRSAYAGLLGDEREDGEKKLRKLGYVKQASNKEQYRLVSRWWNASTGDCVNVTTNDGQVRSIRALDRTQCN